MDIKTALEKLFSMHQFGIKLGLDNINKLLAHIGNPEKNLKAIHVAGSNGKGSTASFIASILVEANYKVALYTSPHYVRFNERIKINGEEISDEYIAGFVESLWDFIEENEPTFFEVTTALAFKYFAEQNIDYAVIETGLGGRLDATNVLNPLISVITTIGLEHTNILGDSLEEIAYEKGGIVKKNIPVVLGYMPEEAEKVLVTISEERHSKVINFKDYVNEFNDHLIVNSNNGLLHLYTSPLPGKHQLRNAAAAVIAVKNILPKLNDDYVLSGIKSVSDNWKIQGRYEIYNENPKVIFDSAHNADGIKSFIEIFKNEYHIYEKRILIFGVMRDKNIKLMFHTIKDYFDIIFVSNINYERAAKIEELKQIAAEAGLTVSSLDNPDQYIEKFITNGGRKCLVVLGSIYFLGEIKEKLII